MQGTAPQPKSVQGTASDTFPNPCEQAKSQAADSGSVRRKSEERAAHKHPSPRGRGQSSPDKVEAKQDGPGYESMAEPQPEAWTETGQRRRTTSGSHGPSIGGDDLPALTRLQAQRTDSGTLSTVFENKQASAPPIPPKQPKSAHRVDDTKQPSGLASDEPSVRSHQAEHTPEKQATGIAREDLLPQQGQQAEGASAGEEPHVQSRSPPIPSKHPRVPSAGDIPSLHGAHRGSGNYATLLPPPVPLKQARGEPVPPASVEGGFEQDPPLPAGLTRALSPVQVVSSNDAPLPSSQQPAQAPSSEPLRAANAENKAQEATPADEGKLRDKENDLEAAGSVEFWKAKIGALVDAEDLEEVAQQLATAGFKKRHLHGFSRADLRDAGLKPGRIKDILDKSPRDDEKLMASDLGATNGSLEFWKTAICALLDAADLEEVAQQLATAGFKKRHCVHGFSRDDLRDAGLKPGRIKDILDKSPRAPSPGPNMVITNVRKIPETALRQEELIGEGTCSKVWKGTWFRSDDAKMVVAIKVSKIGFAADLLRDLTVISNLPHQNIVLLYGICESNPPQVVYECMTSDLAKLIHEKKLNTRHFQIRVLRDISAGVCHLHANGVIHRDLKPGNVLVRDDHVKICDFGTSKDVQYIERQFSFPLAGTLDYMAPEVLARQPASKPVDVWAFGVIMFECFMGRLPCPAASIPELASELRNADTPTALVDLFIQCHDKLPEHRPSAAKVHQILQEVLVQDIRDSDMLKAEIKVAESQDRSTYNEVWRDYEAQPHMAALCTRTQELARTRGQTVTQTLQSPSLQDLEALANQGCVRLHAQMQGIVETNNGKYVQPPRKSTHRTMQKVSEEYGGDYSRLLDLERATGLFNDAEDMLNCLEKLSTSTDILLVRVKDNLNVPRSSGARDLLLNVCEPQTGFVGELQLNFEKIALIKSQTHRFYEMIRVMKLRPS